MLCGTPYVNCMGPSKYGHIWSSHPASGKGQFSKQLAVRSAGAGTSAGPLMGGKAPVLTGYKKIKMTLANTSFFMVQQASQMTVSNICIPHEGVPPSCQLTRSLSKISKELIIALCWDSAYVRVMSFKSRVSVSIKPPSLLREAAWPSEPDIIGAHLSLQGPCFDCQMWHSDSWFLGANSALVIILLFVVCLPESVGLGCITSLPSCLSCCSSFFITSVAENLSASLSGHSHGLLLP